MPIQPMKSVSIVKLLGVELLALIEYARSNSSKVHIDFEKLRSALGGLAFAEANDKIQDESSYVPTGQKATPEYLANLDKSKQKYADRLKRNLESTELMDRMMTVCKGAISGNQSSLLSLYKYGGSVLKFFELDKQLKTDNKLELKCTEDINSSIVYFVPMMPVITKYRELLISRKITPDDAITQIQNEQSILCNYDLKQDADADGYKYIEGGKNGLVNLVGVPRSLNRYGYGVLAQCRGGLETVNSASLVVRKFPTAYGTRYHIRLTSAEAEAFERQLADGSSVLRTEYIQLTEVKQLSDTSTEFSGPGNLEGDGGQQDVLDKEMVEGNEHRDVGINLEKTPQEKLAGSVQYAFNVVNSYLRFKAPNKPIIDMDLLSFTDQSDDTILQMVSYISEFAVKFGEKFGTKVETIFCEYNHETYVVALYNQDNTNAVSRMINIDPRGYKIRLYETLHQRVERTNRALGSFFSKIQGLLRNAFASIQFNQTKENKVSDEYREAIRKSAAAFNEITNQKYQITPTSSLTINTICEQVETLLETSSSDSLSYDTAVIPSDLLHATEKFSRISNRIADYEVVSIAELNQLKQKVLPVIVKYGVHHIKAVLEWNRWKSEKIDIPLESGVKTATLQQIINDSSIVSATTSVKLKKLVKNLILACECLSSYNYDGGETLYGTDYIDLIRSNASAIVERYASKNQSIEPTDKSPQRTAYSSMAVKVNDLADKEAKVRSNLDRFKPITSLNDNQPETANNSDNVDEEELLARRMEDADLELGAW